MVPFLEFGAARGLARDFGYGQDSQNLLLEHKMIQEARDRAEAKAKLMTDDLNYDTPMNEYDRPIAIKTAQEHLMKIGKFYQDNPDALTNIQKRMQLNQLKKELMEADPIVRGKINDAEIKKYKDFVADPKNAELLGTQSFKNITKQYNNFLKHGNSQSDIPDGNYNGFRFSSPIEDFNMDEDLHNALKDQKFDSVIDKPNGYIEYSVSQPVMVQKAKTILNGPKAAEYNAKWEEQKQQPGNPYKSKTEWLVDKMPGYFQQKRIEFGRAPIDDKMRELEFKRQSMLMKEAMKLQSFTDGNGKKQTADIVAMAIDKAIGDPNHISEIPPEILKSYAIGNGFNFGDVEWVNPHTGEPMHANFGTIDKDEITGEPYISVVPDEKGILKHYINTEVQIPIKNWENKFIKKNPDDPEPDIIDYPNLFSFYHGIPELRKDYVGDQGNPVKMDNQFIKFTIRKQFDGNDAATRMSMNNKIGKFAAYDPEASPKTVLGRKPTPSKLANEPDGTQFTVGQEVWRKNGSEIIRIK